MCQKVTIWLGFCKSGCVNQYCPRTVGLRDAPKNSHRSGHNNPHHIRRNERACRCSCKQSLPCRGRGRRRVRDKAIQSGSLCRLPCCGKASIMRIASREIVKKEPLAGLFDLRTLRVIGLRPFPSPSRAGTPSRCFGKNRTKHRNLFQLARSDVSARRATMSEMLS
jgi:hypothetical protein